MLDMTMDELGRPALCNTQLLGDYRGPGQLREYCTCLIEHTAYSTAGGISVAYSYTRSIFAENYVNDIHSICLLKDGFIVAD